jgi:uncharacterized protein (TIGR03435 family)
MARLGLLLVLIVATSLPLASQAPVRFEVASVKPNNTDAEPSMRVLPNGGIAVISVPLLNVIVNAYRVPAFRIIDSPEWVRRERFDISARPPEGVPGDSMLMLQGLLAERFKLRAHRETREQPVYSLVMARSDGRFGPRMQRSTTDCSSQTPTAGGAGDSACAGLMGVGPAGGTIVSKGQPLARMINALSMAVNQSVVDRTGLEGRFDVELRWSADVNTAPANGDTPSIFTALQEQLGLKLESARGPVEVLVIDSVERPTPD